MGAVLYGVFLGAGGCAQAIDPKVPEPIRKLREPRQGVPYELYRPSRYDRRYNWPLVVVCHGPFPDSPNRRIRAWDRLAEEHGFLLASPKLEKLGGWRARPHPQQAALRANEQRILSTVKHIRAGHSVSRDRVFIHGYSTGAGTALYTGLRNPEVFRAVAASFPKFDEAWLSDVSAGLDPLQAVFVEYRFGELLTDKPGRRCCDWLRGRGARLTAVSHGRAEAGDPRPVVAFFQDVVRSVPYLWISAGHAGGDNPLAVRMRLNASFTPGQYQWSFGDGQASSVADPIHVYSEAGVYRVSVTAAAPDGKKYTRSAELRMPEAIVHHLGADTTTGVE